MSIIIIIIVRDTLKNFCKNDQRKKMFGSFKLLKLFTSVFPLSIVVFALFGFHKIIVLTIMIE